MVAKRARLPDIGEGVSRDTRPPPEIVEAAQRHGDEKLASVLKTVARTEQQLAEFAPRGSQPSSSLELPSWLGPGLDWLDREPIAGIDPRPNHLAFLYPMTFPFFLEGVLRTAPYDWSTADPMNPETSDAGHVVRWASADANNGRLALESLVWAGYPSAQEQRESLLGGRFVESSAMVGITFPIPSSFMGTRLRVEALASLNGSGFVSGGFFDAAMGFGFVGLELTLHVYGGQTPVVASPMSMQSEWSIFVASSGGASARMGEVQSVSRMFSVGAFVQPSNQALHVGVKATLRALVGLGSNLIAMGNFSPLSSWAQPRGSIEIPYIYVTKAS